MTLEHRVLYGLADLKAVTLECTNCHARLSVKPSELNVDKLTGCPACEQVWLNKGVSSATHLFEPLSHFVGSIAPALLANANDKPRVKILLEFAEPGTK